MERAELSAVDFLMGAQAWFGIRVFVTQGGEGIVHDGRPREGGSRELVCEFCGFDRARPNYRYKSGEPPIRVGGKKAKGILAK